MPSSSIAIIVLALLGGGAAGCATAAAPPSSGTGQFTETIPGTAVSFVMKRAPLAGPLWVGRTEVTWDAYDVYLYGLNEPQEPDGEADAVSRPSKPYIAMDRGFGHAGYPAISMTHHAAQSFCAWLAEVTGRPYRLPTEAEWRAICGLAGIDADEADAHAWHGGNAGGKTHPVAAKKADALGLHDLHGNAAEWCTAAGGQPVAMGGSYRDDPEATGCNARRPPSPAWNRSDPQFPKSVWWLADAGFVGFRVVCGEQEQQP